jgi:hypothetical protein
MRADTGDGGYTDGALPTSTVTTPRATVASSLRLRRLEIAPVLRVYGPTIVAAYMLATARWGSYLLPGPPYIGDLAVMAIIGERVIAAAQGRIALGSVELTTGVTSGLLLTWACLRFGFGGLSANAIRDFAPYAYAVLVFLTPTGIRTEAVRQNMERLLFGALVFHAAWMTVALLSPSFAAGLPMLAGGQSQLLERRPDVDSTICGILVILCLHRAVLGRRPLVHVAIAVWNAAIVFDDYSRAALAAFCVQLLVFALVTPAVRELLRRYSLRLVIVLVLLVIPAGAYAISNSGVGKRLSQVGGAYVPFVPTTGNPGAGATGTALARRRAWQAIEIYLEAKRSRTWLGVGFGPDFLHDSGGDQLLLGGSSEDVRQPHNFLINTWARLGLIGLGIFLTVIIATVRLVVRIGRSPMLDGLDVIASATAVGLLVASFYGVVLESPFGALPFFWAVGHLGIRGLELRISPALRRP